MIGAEPTAGDVQLDLRPKFVVRVGIPAVVLGVTAWAAPSVGYEWVFGLALAIGVLVVAWRQRIVAVERAVFVRYLDWAPAALLLDQVTTATYAWGFPFKGIPRRELHVVDRAGGSLVVPLWWWGGWRGLVDLVAAESGVVAHGPTVLPIRYRPTAAVPRRA